MKRNDVVRLKTGGPEMVVLRLIGDPGEHVMLATGDEAMRIKGFKTGDPVCQWFDGTQDRMQVFPAQSVVLVREG
jgi:uncharacterized protein YodC (DUF2158 family)